MAVSYSKLREIQKKEMESTALVSLEEDFYSQASELLKAKKKEVMASTSPLAMREYENIRRIISAIQSKREEKIALMSIRSRDQESGLAIDEKEMLNGMREITLRTRMNIENKTSGPQHTAEVNNEKKLKILKEVEQYTGLDNNTYGPFKRGEIASLPSEEANWLLKAKMAEVLYQQR